MFNVVFLVKKREDMTREQFADYWINQHTPITASVPGVLSYQCFPMTRFDAELPPFDAVAVLAFENEDAWRAAELSDEMKNAFADAPNFQDTSATISFFANDFKIV